MDRTNNQELERYLRAVVPCIDPDDPFAVAAYEQALRMWLRKTPLEREASGFAAEISAVHSLGV